MIIPTIVMSASIVRVQQRSFIRLSKSQFCPICLLGRSRTKDQEASIRQRCRHAGALASSSESPADCTSRTLGLAIMVSADSKSGAAHSQTLYFLPFDDEGCQLQCK
eukprot:scaffold274162_cov18-Prasinocladus_malaysianus.AAC.1